MDQTKLSEEKLTLNFSENALKVLEKRYLKKDVQGKVIETPVELFRRVARHIAEADRLYGAKEYEIKLTEDEFFKAMTNLEFMPNSPTLMNAGRELGQLSACFVIPIDDSMESIFDAVKATSLIHKSGGGTGFSFSRLRPKNSVVKSTGGVSSGPVSFMKVFNAATQAVKQGGTRRGANMGILRVDHPDILEFITCKENDKEITNFNISVELTEDFMNKLLNDEEYDLIDPHTKQIKKRLKAREAFNLIVEMAHKNGEPGIIFIDKINQFNSTPRLGQIESTNPCITGDTLISTKEGLLKMEEAVIKSQNGGIEILVDPRMVRSKIGIENKKPYFLPCRGFMTGQKEVFRIKTKAGYELKATANHPILTTEGWVKLENLVLGRHKILIQTGEGRFLNNKKLPFKVIKEYVGRNGRIYKSNLPDEWSEELGILIGWLIGDGNLHGTGESLFFYFGNDDSAALKKIRNILKNFYGKEGALVDRGGEWQLSINSKLLFQFLKEIGVTRAKACEKYVPSTLFRAPKEAIIGFLKGLFSSDGTINYKEGKSAYVRLSSGSLRLLKEVQLLLLNLGIFSRIYENRKKPKDGTFYYRTQRGEERYYSTNSYHELEISRLDVVKFIMEIGFIGDRLNKKIDLLKKKNERKRGYYQRERFDLVSSIKPAGFEEVYDINEPITHSFIANGLVVHNCGEQPLLPYESCNLGSINLSKMIIERAVGCEIDWEKLRKTVHTAVHFLDNVIDMNKFPLKEIETMTKLNRKIGLGVMGWADMLIKLGVPYDTEEAVKLGEEVMKFIYIEAQNKSSEIAKSRGVFPSFEDSIYNTNGKKILRNATVTTIAPAGTISIIAGCSSGIEPIFALSYYRNVLDNEKLIEVYPLFEEIAKKEGFYSKSLMERIAEGANLKDIPEVPEIFKRLFVTAHDIKPIWHIRMQAAFQKWTDNAVSKTVNFPKDATKEDVREVYMLAYKLGCKGVTIYRDKSREEQVLNLKTSEKKAEATIEKKISPKPRPVVTTGTTTKIGTGCGNLYVTINVDSEGKPFEVFTQMGKAGGCAASQLEAIGRLVSLALRSGVEIKSITDQLRGIRCPSPSWEKGGRIFSCADAIARVIEERLLNGKVEQDRRKDAKSPHTMIEDRGEDLALSSPKIGNVVGVCPDCGGALRHEEGCMICRSCGYSKC